MASFDTTQTQVIKTAGYQPALTIVTGTFASSAGATGGVIIPGYDNANGTFTASSLTGAEGCRNIAFDIYTTTTEDATTVKSVISYDATYDRYKVTLTTAANSTGRYTIYCYDNGA